MSEQMNTDVVVSGESFLRSVIEAQVEHSDIRQAAQDARRKTEESYWELSIVLHEIYSNMLYESWGYKTWADYVEIELDIQKRKAQYLVSIQDWFGGMKPNVQKWVRELGWTKAKELVGKVDNNNAEEWRDKVEGKSYRELMNLLAAPAEDKPAPAKPADPDQVTKKNFGLYPDQLSNVDLALQLAKEIAQSDSDNHALDMVCLEFVSSHQMNTVQEYLAKAEGILGVKLIAYDPKEDSIVFGGETLDALVDGDGDE